MPVGSAFSVSRDRVTRPYSTELRGRRRIVVIPQFGRPEDGDNLADLRFRQRRHVRRDLRCVALIRAAATPVRSFTIWAWPCPARRAAES
jgi:hypothetical protein